MKLSRMFTGASTSAVAAQSRHLPELDALRGAAAFVVLLTHFHGTWLLTSHPGWISRPRLVPPLWLLLDGHASVILFFLLSGFVLALPRLHGARPSYPVYALRRICRIYLPYLAALFLAVGLCAIFHRFRLDGGLLGEAWRQSPDLHSILQHLLMLGRFDIYRYDGPIWSLVHEMRVSLVFPLILLCALRLRALSTLLLAGAMTVGASVTFALYECHLPDHLLISAWSLSLCYCGIFLMGAGLARRYRAFTGYVERLRPAKRACLFAAGMTLYLYTVPTWHRIATADFSIACGGLVILTYALRERGVLAALLRMRSMQFLGRISFSLYLLHFPILFMLSPLRSPRASFGWLFLPYLALSLLAAAAMYRWVEMPAMALGRRVHRLHLPVLPGLRLQPESNPQT